MLGFQESLDGSLIRAILSLGGTSWTEHRAGSLSYSNYENGNHKPLPGLLLSFSPMCQLDTLKFGTCDEGHSREGHRGEHAHVSVELSGYYSG